MQDMNGLLNEARIVANRAVKDWYYEGGRSNFVPDFDSFDRAAEAHVRKRVAKEVELWGSSPYDRETYKEVVRALVTMAFAMVTTAYGLESIWPPRMNSDT